MTQLYDKILGYKSVTEYYDAILWNPMPPGVYMNQCRVYIYFNSKVQTILNDSDLYNACIVSYAWWPRFYENQNIGQCKHWVLLCESNPTLWCNAYDFNTYHAYMDLCCIRLHGPCRQGNARFIHRSYTQPTITLRDKIIVQGWF